MGAFGVCKPRAAKTGQEQRMMAPDEHFIRCLWRTTSRGCTFSRRLTDVIFSRTLWSSQHYNHSESPRALLYCASHKWTTDCWTSSAFVVSFCISQVSHRQNILEFGVCQCFCFGAKWQLWHLDLSFAPATLLVCEHFEVCVSVLSLFSQASRPFQTVTLWLLAILPLFPVDAC